jgi:hypothetical protein
MQFFSIVLQSPHANESASHNSEHLSPRTLQH